MKQYILCVLVSVFLFLIGMLFGPQIDDAFATHEITISDSTYYHRVICNGFSVFVLKTGDIDAYSFLLYNEAVDTNYMAGFIAPRFTNTTAEFRFYYANDRVTTITEHDGTMVKAVVTGTPRNSGDTTNMTNCTSFTMTAYIYADRVALEHSLVLSGDFVLTSSTGDNRLDYTQYSAGTSDGVVKYENSGSEANGANSTFYNTADYIALTSGDINIQRVDMANSDSGVFGQFCSTALATSGMYGLWYNGTLSSGTHYDRIMYIIDSAGRDGSVQLYNSAARLIIGDQFKDYELDS